MSERKRAGYRERCRMRARLKAIGAPCAICGKPIDYDLDWWVDPKDGRRKRHPFSFEWDHRDPHALGGSDGFDNAQPAHRLCNQRKGDGRRRRRKAPPAPTHTGDAPMTRHGDETPETSRAW